MPNKQWRVKFRDGTYELVIADGRSEAIKEARQLRKQRRSAFAGNKEQQPPDVASVKQVGT